MVGRKKKRFCGNYYTPQKLHLANKVLNHDTVAPRGRATDQKMQEMNGRCWNFKHIRWRESKQQDAGSQSRASFFSRCLNVATRHKPITRFESPANSFCVTEAALSAAQADTLYSPAPGFCRVGTMRARQSAQRGSETSSPREV